MSTMSVAAVANLDWGDGVGGLSAGLVNRRCGLLVAGGVAGLVAVVVLGPLVVVGPDLASVLLIIVGLGGDGVIRLAPSGVGVRAVGLLGPLIVVIAGLLSGPLARRLFLLMSALGNLAFVLLDDVVLAVATVVSTMSVTVSTVWVVSVTVAVVLLLRCNSLGSLVIVTLRGVPVLGRGTILVSVLAPSLGSPLVVVLVVPFVIGLGVVGLGPCAVIRLLDAQVLVSAPSIPVGAGLATVPGVGGLRGAVPLAALLHTVGVATVATLAKAAVGVAEVAGVLLGPLGGLLAAGVGVTGVVSVVVLSPLVIISLNGSGVALVVVRLGGDGIVGLAPSGVEVGAVSLLGPLVIVVGTACSLGVVGGAAPVAVHLTVACSL